MIRLLVILCLALASAAFAAEDTADYYFDNGAEQYTRDDIETAKKWVDEGLQLYAGDQKLIALKQLLEQQEQQNQQQQQQQQQQNQQNQQNQDQSQSAQNQDQQNQGDDQKDQQEQQDSQQAAQQQTAGDDKQDDGKDEQQARAMTPEEAERILDAMRERESSDRAKMAEEQIRQQMGKMPMVEKDW